MVRWAVARGDLDHSPIDGLRGPAISKPRTRTLADPEIRAVWHDLYDQRPDVGRVVRFCLATGQRIGEVVGITPSELDLLRYDQKFCKRDCLERWFIAERRQAVKVWRAQQRVASFLGLLYNF